MYFEKQLKDPKRFTWICNVEFILNIISEYNRNKLKINTLK